MQPCLHLGVVAIEKGAFGLPSTKIVNLTYYFMSKWILLKIICLVCFGFFSLFKSILTFVGYLMPKQYLQENFSDTI